MDRDALEDTLERLGLLQDSGEDGRAHPEADAPGSTREALVALCDQGRLRGGLSFAREVSPDEAFGPLVTAMGGAARRLKLLDVLEREGTTLLVAEDGESEAWAVPSLPALLARLDARFRDAAGVSRVLVLGATDRGDLQIWLVSSAHAEALLRLPGLDAETLRPRDEASAPVQESEPPAPPRPTLAPPRRGLTLELQTSAGTGLFDVPEEAVRYELGSGAQADLRLEGEGVARAHALLLQRGGWRLRPAPGAAVSLRLNDAELEPAGALLSDGDVVRLGSVTLRVRLPPKG